MRLYANTVSARPTDADGIVSETPRPELSRVTLCVRADECRSVVAAPADFC